MLQSAPAAAVAPELPISVLPVKDEIADTTNSEVIPDPSTHTPVVIDAPARPAVADEAKARYGVRVAPITVVGDQFFYGTFEQQRPELEPLFA